MDELNLTIMKKSLPILLIAIFSIAFIINAKAQNSYDNIIYPFANDSLVYEEFDQGAWAIDSRQKYSLYPDRRPDYVRIYQASSATSFMFDYLWDANNKLMGYDLKFNLGGQEINVTELRLTRDAQGNVVEEVLRELDQPGLPLVEKEKVFYTYNAQNKLISEIREEWDDNITPAAWVKVDKILYQYNAGGKLSVQLDSLWVSNSNAYMFQQKTTFEYDANGKLIYEYQKDQSDVEVARTTLTYNSAGYLKESVYETKDGANYKLMGKDSIVFDASNMITQEFSYNFDFNVNKVILTHKMNSLGSVVGVFSANKLLKQLVAYPNPTTGNLTLKLNSNSEKEVEVFNIIGDKVMSLTLGSTENSINLSDLVNGIYTIKVKTANGDFQNKVILNR